MRPCNTAIPTSRKFFGALTALLLPILIHFGYATPALAAPGQEPAIIGLDADMSSGSAQAGEAIRRGAVLAIDEINAAGGVLGRKLQLIVQDHRGNPARGIDNITQFAQTENLVAVIAGLHTPVALHELEAIQRLQIVYLVPWAAGTPIIDNGYDPNFAFRVSVRDEYAGSFLVSQALAKGYRHPGLLLENTGWGRSNQRAMTNALAEAGFSPAGVQWFLWGTEDMHEAVNALQLAGADSIMFVGNAPEGLTLIETLAARPESNRLPIISHWGITGGDFHRRAGADLEKVELSFLQTFSFLRAPYPERRDRLFAAYRRTFPDVEDLRDIFSPVGTAHAYDLVHLLARAIGKAGSLDRTAIRDALENLERYEGLIRNYDPPFTAQNHDALSVQDFHLARFGADGAIEPIGE